MRIWTGTTTSPNASDVSATHTAHKAQNPARRTEGHGAYPQTGGWGAVARRALYLVCCGARAKSTGVATLQSKLEQSTIKMRSLVESAVVAPSPGEKHQPDEEAWATVHEFDALRSANSGCIDMSSCIKELVRIAEDASHLSSPDAKLFMDIMNRPLGDGRQSLEEYLAARVEAGLNLGKIEIPENPDFRTFNSVLPGLATSTVDYNSVARTLLFKGATHWMRIPSAPKVADAELSEAQLDRKKRLQNTIFHFSKRPMEGNEKRLKLSDFADPINDPLDLVDGTYMSSGPQLT